MDRRRARLTLRADGLGFAKSLSAKGLGARLRALRLDFGLGARSDGGSFCRGGGMPGLSLSLRRVGLCVRFLLRHLAVGLGLLLAR